MPAAVSESCCGANESGNKRGGCVARICSSGLLFMLLLAKVSEVSEKSAKVWKWTKARLLSCSSEIEPAAPRLIDWGWRSFTSWCCSTYLETGVQRTCSGGPRGRSWAGLGAASRRSADAEGGSPRAGAEPQSGRGGSRTRGTPAPGSDKATWPEEPGMCSLTHPWSGWSR